jgi:HEAT repeat protein
MNSAEFRHLVFQLGQRSKAWEAYEILIQQGTDSVEPLCWALAFGDRNMRWFAATALCQIRDARATDHLIRALKERDANVHAEVARALARIGVPAVKPLITALGSRNEQIRQGAASALKQIGDACVIEPLFRALRHMDYGQRRSAAEALGLIKDPRAVEPLVRMLGDKVAGVRRAAADALALIGVPSIKPLIPLIGDERPNVAQHVLDVLRQVGESDVVLRRILAEPSLTAQQRFTAMTALNRVPDVQEFCRQKLDDLHESVRQGAQSVLEVSDLLIPCPPRDLRGATQTGECLAGEMLRGSFGADAAAARRPPRRSLLARLTRR